MSDYLHFPNNLKDISLLFVIEAIFISEQIAECRIGATILESFTTILYDFEKQWLSSFA